MLLPLVTALQHFTSEPAPALVAPGGEVVLPCRVGGRGGQCRWEMDGVPVGLHPGKYEWAEEGECSLRVLQAAPEWDAGLWQCQVSASSPALQDALLSRPARLQVQSAPTRLAILGVGEVGAGEVLELLCEAEGGLPAPTLLWRVAGREVLGAEEREGASLLRLPVTREDHGAEVECEARHPTLPAPWRERVQLLVRHPPRVTTRLHPGDPVEEGATVTLSCWATAHPPSTPVWRRAGSSLPLPSTGGVLVLAGVRREQAGAYSCQAANPEGLSSASLQEVRVEWPPVEATVGPGATVLGRRGGDLALSCMAEAHPLPSYRWLQQLEGEVRTTLAITCWCRWW